MKHSAQRTALRDISRYLKKENIKVKNKFGDILVVTPNFLLSKATRDLNYQLLGKYKN